MSNYLQQVRDRLISYRDNFQTELTESEFHTIANLLHKLDHTAIDIAVFGMVSRGKTSLLNALLGQKLGKTSALNGTTTEVTRYSSDLAARSKINLNFIDTQGIDEVGGENRAEFALTEATKADLILFVIAGDITRLEQEAIADLQRFYKPILLVFNKTDLYSDSDRISIHQALQNEIMKEIISPEEIVLVAAEPKPIKVRLQYADGNSSREVWENPPPNLQDLKARVLELLNTEGRELLAVNVLRSLLEIQVSVTQRHLHKLQASTAITALIFMSEAFSLLISPTRWLDAAISIFLNGILIVWAINKYAVPKKYLWFLLVFAIAIASSLWSEFPYIQILWTGLGVFCLFNGVMRSLQHGLASKNLGVKGLLAEVIANVPPNSILQRFQKI